MKRMHRFLPDALRRRRPADRLPLQLDRHRIYIVPSRAGLGWAGLLATMFFGALNYMNNAALLLTCELACAMALTMLAGFRNLYRLTLQSAHCRHPVAGQTAILELRLARPARPHVQLQARAAGQPAVRFDLNEREDPETLRLPARFTARGLQPLPPIRMQTRWPLGLFTAWAILRPAGTVLVWPAPEQPGPPLPRGPGGGPSDQGRRQATDRPDGLRAYRPGDAPAHVAWKLLARSDEWHTKTAPPAPARGRLELRWEQTDGLGHAARIARLAHWLQQARQSGLSYSLQLPGTRIEHGGDALHYARCMDALARLP